MELNKSNIKKILGIITFTILLYVGVQNLILVLGALYFVFNLIFPFILGAAIAFIINVPMKAIEKRLFTKDGKHNNLRSKLKRPVSLIITLVLVIGVVVMVMLMVVPEIINTLRTISESNVLPEFFHRVETNYINMVQKYPFMKNVININTINWQGLIKGTYAFIIDSGANMLQSTFSTAFSIFGGMIDFFLGFIFSIYILAEKEKLGGQVRKLMYAYLPEKAVSKILSICSLSERTFSRFLSGQCLEAVILGVMFFVVMLIFQFPYALLISVLIGFTALIPIFGAFIGCVIGAFLILMVNPLTALLFVLTFVILQQIEGNFIYPRVVGGSIGLPSMWVLVAVTIGGSTMGVAGMLIFIPMFSVLYTLLREAVNRRLVLRKVNSNKYN
ncbi:MAG: putative permease [Herbinix sp.]|jgi:predicted PurR-regulated permease PerM|nr:putative permease [Herbinix sp.]